ncbi:MAG: DNA methylase [Erysipelotrichaceae bacterium]|nr:DNA methylase [Erysipelotrichaceae bacterium]
MNNIYFAIDLKSFYASVECIERNLDPLNTNLVVADISRKDKTICLAVSPSLKKLGIPSRPRLFEVKQKIKHENFLRIKTHKKLIEKSCDFNVLNTHKNMEIDFIIATPRMSKYIEYSTKIFNIYLKYFSEEDIHIYSIDEVFINVTPYINIYKLSYKELASLVMNDILKTTKIISTCGIGTNLYLAKVAMDILAKKVTPDNNGFRISELDEISFRKKLWNHKPLTDFWRIGKGYYNKLIDNGIYTMGDIARCSLGKDNEYHNEKLLYKLFGINAELLIDHSWGFEPCTIKDIKNYKPHNNTISSGQVLHESYSSNEAKIIVKEMTENLVYELLEKNLITNQIFISIGYDVNNDKNDRIETIKDYYGRILPKPSHKCKKLNFYTNSLKLIVYEILNLFEKVVNHDLIIKNINIGFSYIKKRDDLTFNTQLSLFTDSFNIMDEHNLKKEEKIQRTIINLKNKYGKNSILKVSNLLEKSTMKDRNIQIGGHKA